MVATCIHYRISLLHSRTHLSKTPKLPHTKSLNGRTICRMVMAETLGLRLLPFIKAVDSCIKVERNFSIWLLRVVTTEYPRLQSHHLRDSNDPKLPQYKVAHLVKDDFLYYNTDND